MKTLTLVATADGTTSNYIEPEEMLKIIPVIETFIAAQKKIISLEQTDKPIRPAGEKPGGK